MKSTFKAKIIFDEGSLEDDDNTLVTLDEFRKLIKSNRYQAEFIMPFDLEPTIIFTKLK